MMSVADPVLPEYLWLVVCGSFAAFFLGLGVGANDVGNSFASSVGSRSLTLKQAILIAVVFETLGSMVLGRTITSTIQSGIADAAAFSREPQVFAYGMLCAMTTTGVWQLVGQYYELNVASGQSLVGSIIGFSLVYAGKDAVLWKVDDPNVWPPYKGMVPIVLTWFFSPIFTAAASAILFAVLRTAVLRRKEPHIKAFWALPPAVAVTAYVSIYFVLTKGAKKYILEHNKSWTDDTAAWVAAVATAGCTLFSICCLPFMRRAHGSHYNDDGTRKASSNLTLPGEAAATADAAPSSLSGSDAGSGSAQDPKVALAVMEAGKAGVMATEQGSDGAAEQQATGWKAWGGKVWSAATYGTRVDVHAAAREDMDVAAVHANAELFDPRAEHVFSYLQIFSAICVMFAHGAGEVGYMAGPLATAWHVYTEGALVKSLEAPIWATIIGTAAMCIGLTLVGYKMMSAMGVRLTYLSPSRGFVAELSTALVVLVTSQWGLPSGGSQCIVGGILGVGLLEGRAGVNWGFFAKQFGAWVITIFLMGITCAALFAQGIYAPGKLEGRQQIAYEDSIASLSSNMFDTYRASLDSYAAAAAAGALAPRLDQATLAARSAALRKMSTDVKALAGTKIQTVEAEKLISYLHSALALYQADSVLSVGQTDVFPGAAVCNSNVTADITAGVTVACPAPRLLPRGVNATVPK